MIEDLKETSKAVNALNGYFKEFDVSFHKDKRSKLEHRYEKQNKLKFISLQDPVLTNSPSYLYCLKIQV